MTNWRKQAHIAHAAFGWSGAAFCIALIVVLFALLPRLMSTLAHADKAGENTVDATKVWADASREQTAKVNDALGKFSTAIDHFDSMTGTAQVQMSHVGPMLDKIGDAAGSIPPFVKAAQADMDQTAGTAQHAMTSAGGALDQLTEDLDDAHRTMTDERVGRLIGSLASMAAHGDAITGDVQVKLHPILNPEKCKTKGCAIRRAIPRILSTATDTGVSGYWVTQFIRALRAH